MFIYITDSNAECSLPSSNILDKFEGDLAELEAEPTEVNLSSGCDLPAIAIYLITYPIIRTIIQDGWTVFTAGNTIKTNLESWKDLSLKLVNLFAKGRMLFG